MAFASAVGSAALAMQGMGQRHMLRWEDAATRSGVPSARGGASIAHFQLDDQSIEYEYGGCSEVQCFDDTQRYDHVAGSWALQHTTGKPPSKRRGHTATMLGEGQQQRMCVHGGWSGGGAGGPVASSLKCLEVAPRAWVVPNVAGTPPSARWAHTATNVDANRMLIFGGEGQVPGEFFKDLYLFDGETDQWSLVPPRCSAEKGVERGGDDSVVEAEVPPGRMGHTATLVRQAMYVWGGYSQEQRGPKFVTVALNDLWVLDLREGVQKDMQWINMPTIGKAPAARAFHSAVGAAGNLFVAGGCDMQEGACYNDIHMLDTEYYDGMRWTELPVGLQRFAPRHQFALWVSGNRLLAQGGCAPAMASVGQEQHCFADMWQLQLGNLLHGAKTLNVTANGTVVESASQAADQESDPLVEAGNVANGSATWPTKRNPNLPQGAQQGGQQGAQQGASSPTPADGSAGNGSDPNAIATGNGTNATEGGIVVSDGGMDKITGASLPGAQPEAHCTDATLSRCETTQMLQTAGALAESVLVVDTSTFVLGRYIRINPGHDTQEDSRVVGFGRRLTTEEVSELAGASARDAAERAVERRGKVALGGRGGPVLESSVWPRQRGQRAGASLLQLGEGTGETGEADEAGEVGGVDGVGEVGELEAVGEMLQLGEGALQPAATQDPLRAMLQEGTKQDLPPVSSEPRKAAQRIHGRELHYYLNLSRPLQFAHVRGEVILQLPETTHEFKPSPGMQHTSHPTAVRAATSPPPPYVASSAQGGAGAAASGAMPGGAADGGALAGQAGQEGGGDEGQQAAGEGQQGQVAADEDMDEDDEDDEDDDSGGERMFVRGTPGGLPAANVGAAAGGGGGLPGRSARAGGGVKGAGTVSWISSNGTIANDTTANGSASSSVNGTSSESGFQAQLEEIFGKLPLWVWVSCASAAALLVCGGAAAASFSRAKKRRKRMAKLEDVQPVFQTETWRKLN